MAHWRSASPAALEETLSGVAAGSASLQADALGFLGDAANYPISLTVVGTGTGLPDAIVATIMAALGISAGWQVARHALIEVHR